MISQKIFNYFFNVNFLITIAYIQISNFIFKFVGRFLLVDLIAVMQFPYMSKSTK